MSYWVYLTDAPTGQTLYTDYHAEGGTYALGGTHRAELNVTYNYSKWYSRLGEEGLRWLDGKTARATIARLERAVETLGTQQDDDYWKATSGNAGYALSILLRWARQHPDGVWVVH